MPLDESKLQNLRVRHGKKEAQCPACHEEGNDRSGNHLFINADGAFGCVMNPGDGGLAHRRRIAELAGDESEDFKRKEEMPAVHRTTTHAGPKSDPRGHPAKREKRDITTETPFDCAYVYNDDAGQPLFEVRRYVEPKDFRPFKIIKGERVPGLGGVTRIPYRLPELIAAETVWIVEGEKDADTLAALGIAATCRAGGSSTWEADLTPWFKDKEIVLCGDNDAPGQKFMDAVAAALKGTARKIRRVEVPTPHKDVSDALEGLSDAEAKAFIDGLLVDPMAARLEPKRFDISRPPKRTEPVLWVGDTGIAKPGDLVVIQAQVKSGKSSILAAMMGCLMGAGRLDCDFLGIKGVNPGALPVLHIDTEQTPEDHYDMIMRTLKRARLDAPPPWFHSYCLTEFKVDDRRKAINFEVDRLVQKYGALCSMFLDGSADLVHDVNDADEANQLVDELYAMAIRAATPILSVIHENHSSEDGKTRGHLGSQLMRKAASNLRLAKDGTSGIIQLWGEKLRRGHIAKGTGPHFIWDDERNMHISCGTTSEATAKQSLAPAVDDIFSSHVSYRYGELVTEIKSRLGCSEKTAKRRLEDMRAASLITSANGFYMKGSFGVKSGS